MVRYFFWPAHRSVKQRIKAFELLKPVVGQHFAVFQVVVAATKLKRGEFQVDIEALGGGF